MNSKNNEIISRIKIGDQIDPVDLLEFSNVTTLSNIFIHSSLSEYEGFHDMRVDRLIIECGIESALDFALTLLSHAYHSPSGAAKTVTLENQNFKGIDLICYGKRFTTPFSIINDDSKSLVYSLCKKYRRNKGSVGLSFESHSRTIIGNPRIGSTRLGLLCIAESLFHLSFGTYSERLVGINSTHLETPQVIPLRHITLEGGWGNGIFNSLTADLSLEILV